MTSEQKLNYILQRIEHIRHTREGGLSIEVIDKNGYDHIERFQTKDGENLFDLFNRAIEELNTKYSL